MAQRTVTRIGGHLVAEAFEALGAQVVMGLPGIHALPIWEALRTSPIRDVAFRTELAAGFALSISSDSKKKVPAYLFIQWLNSNDISIQRVQLPYALRDPFRENHFTSAEYMGRWPEAQQYLEALKAGAVNGLLDLSIIQTDKYEEALRQGVSKLWAGENPKAILDQVAAEWDALTDRIGVDKQRAAYEAWASKPNAYPAAT